MKHHRSHLAEILLRSLGPAIASIAVPMAALLFIGMTPATGHASDEAVPVANAAESSLGRAAQHGLAKLEQALRDRGHAVHRSHAPSDVTDGWLVVAGITNDGGLAARLSRESGSSISAAESLCVIRTEIDGRQTLVLCGSDDRGLMYAALDTAARVGWAEGATDPFSEAAEVTASPTVHSRSVSTYTMNRAWWEQRFYDEEHWIRYFDMLAANRFNHFLIIFGYENGGFLAPAYPYFFDTPGFPDVRMVDHTPEQQRRNLAALNRLIELAHDRGVEVGIGFWDHIYRGGVQSGGNEWEKSFGDRPVPNTVQGVTAENLNAYTLAALSKFFDAVPELDTVQFRIHWESGLKREETDAFWAEVFEIVQEKRPGMLVEARAKGTPDSVIESALKLGINLRISTKYWMEQMGPPFHPTHINTQNQRDRRHGYADLLRYPARYPMNWRLWNGGTTRVLQWGDPDYVRRIVASTALYDSPNLEVNEPLATKMEAQHPDMPPFDLLAEPYRYYDYEFERYWHFFQLFGRLSYNPDAAPELWEHEFARRFGAASPHVEAGLHRASQVLPRIIASVYPYKLFPTTRGWAERQSLGASLPEYADNEGTDIQQFESFAEAAQRIEHGSTTTRRTPADTSRWFDETADAIFSSVAGATENIGDHGSREFDATITDLKILAHLARFHARRALAAVDYNRFLLSSDPARFAAAVEGEGRAIEAWAAMVDAAGDRYYFDLAMGARNYALCGHWRDELVALQRDFYDLKQTQSNIKWKDIDVARAEPRDSIRPRIDGDRIATAAPLQPLRITARVDATSGIESVRLRYRHVTQFEDYESLAMLPSGEPDQFSATVPAGFITPEWDFMYFIEATDQAGNGTQWPDLEVEAPYIIVPLDREK